MSSSTLTDPSERTPLIPKSQSQVFISDRRLYSENENANENENENENEDEESISIDGKGGREVEVYKPGKSSFTQTVSTTLTRQEMLL